MSSSPYVGHHSTRQRSRGRVAQIGLMALGTVLVATAGLSALPPERQQSAFRALCSGVTLGQKSCEQGPIAQVAATSFPDQCAATNDVDALVPLVVAGNVAVAAGGSLQVWNRANDTSVVVADEQWLAEPPEVLAGDGRAVRQVTGDVALPRSAAWLAATSRLATHGVPEDIHQAAVWRAQRQSLASVGFRLRGVPRPTVRRPDVVWLTHSSTTPVVPNVAVAASRTQPNVLYPAVGEPSLERVEVASGASRLMYPLQGDDAQGQQLRGSLRVDRDRAGNVERVIAVTASAQPGGAAVTLAWLTAKTDTDQHELERWLADLPSRGVAWHHVTGQRPPTVDDEIGNLWATGGMLLGWGEPGRDVQHAASWWAESLVQGFRAAAEHPETVGVWRSEPVPAGAVAKQRKSVECGGLPL